MSPAVVDRARLEARTVERLIAEAEAWLGTVEQPRGSNKVPGITDWYGLVGPWCAMGVSRWFFDAGLPLPASTSKGFAFTPAGAAWFKQQGRWKTSNPQRGDVVFFRMPGGPPRINHVGIVTGVNADGSVNTIEGNTDERGGRTGGKVMRKVRKTGIVGYGSPAYTAEPANPQEAHMLFPGTQTVPVPGARPRDGDNRWPMWGWRPDGSVYCWNFYDGLAQRVPSAEEKATITAGGATVIGLHPRTDGVFGYYLVTDDADDRAGLQTYTF